MKRICVALLALCLVSPVAAQDAIDLVTLNNIINQTNFIVGGNCSGTLIDLKEKLILTNHHCVAQKITTVEQDVESNGRVTKVRIKKSEDVVVEQNTYQGFTKVGTSTYITEIVADNKKVDLALLRIKGEIPHNIASKVLPEGQKLIRGERVYIVGNPAMQDASLVQGIISNLNRTFELPWTGNEKVPMIQFSGGLYGGNSGGALYNGNGFLIGVPAAGHREATFIGLAIPVDVVKTFLTENCFGKAFNEKADDATCKTKKKEKPKDKED
jgi:S1-C subfamily serine protease